MNSLSPGSATVQQRTRYARCFAAAAVSGAGVVMPFWMLGDPTPQRSLDIIEALIEAGADALELGLPFSDAVADGPVIQAAARRALGAGTTPAIALDLVARLRARHTTLPIGLLTYLNLVVHAGPEAFARAAGAAGLDSVLIADLPSVECAPYATALRGAGVASVMIVPPNANAATFAAVARHGAGFTYVSGRAGVTGTERAMESPAAGLIEALRAHGAAPPLIGFGVSTPAHVRAARRAGAAGAIVGSALIAVAPDAHAVASRFAGLRRAWANVAAVDGD